MVARREGPEVVRSRPLCPCSPRQVVEESDPEVDPMERMRAAEASPRSSRDPAEIQPRSHRDLIEICAVLRPRLSPEAEPRHGLGQARFETLELRVVHERARTGFEEKGRACRGGCREERLLTVPSLCAGE